MGVYWFRFMQVVAERKHRMTVGLFNISQTSTAKQLMKLAAKPVMAGCPVREVVS